MILGDGKQRGAWQRLAASLGVADHLDWAGSLPHAEALARLGACDVLAFTGLQEGTPVTVLEALARGLPVVCHDCCGMRFAVTDDCGVRVPPAGIEASVAGFACALERLARDRRELARLSAGATRRAGELTWRRLAADLAGDYHLAVEAAH